MHNKKFIKYKKIYKIKVIKVFYIYTYVCMYVCTYVCIYMYKPQLTTVTKQII